MCVHVSNKISSLFSFMFTCEGVHQTFCILLLQFTNNSVFMLPSEDSAFVVLRQPLDYEAMVKQVGSGLLAVYRMNITATVRTLPHLISLIAGVFGEKMYDVTQ